MRLNSALSFGRMKMSGKAGEFRKNRIQTHIVRNTMCAFSLSICTIVGT